MLSPYRFQSNSINKRIKKAKITNSNKDTQPNHDDKRPQMTSKHLRQNKKNEIVLKAGSVQQKIEINEHYLDEFLDINSS